MCAEIWCFWPLTASTTSEVKNAHAHVATQRILNKFIGIKFSIGCMVWPWCCLNQHWTTMSLINKIGSALQKGQLEISHVIQLEFFRANVDHLGLTKMLHFVHCLHVWMTETWLSPTIEENIGIHIHTKKCLFCWIAYVTVSQWTELVKSCLVSCNAQSHLICNHFFRKVGLQTRNFFLVREKLTRKIGGFYTINHLFSGWRKVVLQTQIFF